MATTERPAARAGGPRAPLLRLRRLLGCVALLCGALAAGAGPDSLTGCMPAPSERMAAFRNTVVYNLGAGAADDVRWNPRTTVPTLATLAPLRALAVRRG